MSKGSLTDMEPESEYVQMYSDSTNALKPAWVNLYRHDYKMSTLVAEPGGSVASVGP